jgi:hypothetical protein
MKLKNLSLLILLALTFGSYGCAGEEEARQFALQLRASIIEDEKLIDKNIEDQTTFYEKQRKLIEDSRVENNIFEIDGERRFRSAKAASVLSANPQQEARLSNLMEYLIETDKKEYELWQKLNFEDQRAREDLKSKIAKLQRQKKVLTQVKDNLNQLALAKNRKARAKMLLQFSQETLTALKESK